MATVPVVFIFTRGARSSETPELRNARIQSDLRRANEAWSTGFPGGVSCGINFVQLAQFYHDDVTIEARSVQNVNDPRIWT